jgi:hypothetical protein
MSKLKNVKALNEMLRGEHRTQTRKSFGFSDAKNTNVVRNVGDVWSEEVGEGNVVWWEQKDGYRVKRRYAPEVEEQMEKLRRYLNSFPNCQKEKCTCVQPTHLDLKFRKIMGLCHDCVVTMETRLKMRGEFDQYAVEKMKQNANSFFAQADKEVEIIKQSLNSISFAGENDEVETWSSDNVKALMEKIDTDYNMLKEKVFGRLNN